MKNKRKHIAKRGIALVLSIAMFIPLLSNAIVVRAETEYSENNAYDLEAMKAELLESEEAQAITEPTLTFPITTAIVPVGTEMIFHLFRQGSTEKEETVTLGTYDMTAGYGEDYEILVDGKTIDGEARKFIDGTDTVYDVYMDENVLAEDESEDTTEAEASYDAATQEAVDAQAEMLKEMTSSFFEVTFAEGEAYKELRIRGFVPDKAVGNKEFQLFIMECDEGTATGENVSVAVTLQDNREQEQTKIEIIEDSVEVVDGYVTVMVERSGNTENYTTYTLNSQNGTAENGSDFVLNAAQLTFTPGVTKQRIHIPLVSSDVEEEKSFILKANDDEEIITYTTTERGATYGTRRDMVHVPLSDFQLAGMTADEANFSYSADDERYVFSFDTGIGHANNCTASICSTTTYDFTGIEAIRLSASYRVGTIIGDFLCVYASNTDYYNNLGSLATLATMEYGQRITTVSLTGQGIHDIGVNRIGDYHIYMTAQQHDGCGYIGYNLYEQPFENDDKDKGHVVLLKKPYTIELVNPRNIASDGTTSTPAGDLLFTLMSNTYVKGQSIDNVYRDDSFQFSYTKVDKDVTFKGYELLDDNDNVLFRKWTESNVFCLSSEILKYVESQGVSKVRVRPIFDRPDVEVTVKAQDFEEMGMSGFSASINNEKKQAIFYDNGTEMATVTWNQASYKKGDTLKFSIQMNSAYEGDYTFDSYKERSSNRADFADMNPIYHSNKTWSIALTHSYYEITPMFSCFNAPFYVNVSNATHGSFVGKPENLTTDDYVVKDMDGVYETTDIVSLAAKPDSGYRAKWSYKDTASGNMVTYYGNVFYYEMQFPITSTDNYVYLDFEKVTTEAKEYKVLTTLYMQGGDIMHTPDPESTDYFPLEGAQVAIDGKVLETTEGGGTGKDVFTVSGYGAETHRAMIMANNRTYIYDIVLPESNESSVRADIKLSYYYDGPHVRQMQYYDHLGNTQSGDTIYMEDQLECVIIAASIEENDKEVTHVLYSLTDSEGNPKMDSVEAELNGDEYIWAATLGSYATYGDQIWIELVNRETDADGNIVKQTSYGKVNTGYKIVVAEYKEVSYLPDTGNVSSKVPIFGNMFFNFNVGPGIKPVFTTSRSGNFTFLTMGINVSTAANFTQGKLAMPNWQAFKANAKAGLQYIGKAAQRFSGNVTMDELVAGKQVLKKSVLSLNIPMTFTMILYSHSDADGLYEELYMVAGYVAVGVNLAYLFSYPFLVEGFPMFVNLKITAGMSDTIQFYDRTDTGLVTVNQLWNPKNVAYRGANDFNEKFDLAISVGAGVNSVLSVSGGGSGTMTFDWVDFTYGKGKLSLNILLTIEVILIGRTFSYNLKNFTLFDENPYTAVSESAEEQTVEENDLMTTKLNTFKLRSLDSYRQSVSGSLNSGTWINDAYEFSKPEIVSMGNNRYLIVATVNSSHVNGYEEEDSTAVMSYAVYNADTKTFEKNGDKIFTSLEPMDAKTGKALNPGDSLNFNPSVTVTDDGYAIVWNSLEYGTNTNTEDLTIDKMRIVIKSAVVKAADISKGSMTPVYKSIVVANASDEIMPSLVTKAVYDSDNQEVLLLYRTLDFSTLNENSTLDDYSKVGTSLSVTSLDVSEAALADADNAWTESLVVASNEQGSVLKDSDIAMMEDNGTKVPVLVYHEAKGKYAGLLFNAENDIYEDADTSNHIYLASLQKSGSGYEINKSVELPIDTTKQQESPRLANGKAGDLAVRPMLMWKQKNRIAVADPIGVLNGSYENPDYKLTGLATINDVTAGNSGGFKLVEGDDDRLYCLWTDVCTSEDECANVIKMSVLEQDETGAAYWTEAKEIVHTSGNNYIQSISASVDENGNLRTISSQRDLSTEDGTSQIQMDAQDNLSTVLLSDDTQEDEAIERRDSVYASPNVEITNLRFIANNVTDGVNPDTYTVKAMLTNSGEVASEETEFVVSYLENKNNEDGEDTIYETTLGQTTVPALEVGESVNVSFEITVDQSYYENKHFGVAPLGVALYEYYGEEDQNMVDMMLDGVVAKTEEEATDLEVTAPKTIGVNRTKALQTRVYPVTAQQYENLTFTSSDSKIAKVDENGVLTGVSTGECTVTVTSASGIEKSVPITVTKDDVDDDSNDSNNSDNSNDNNGNNNNSNNGNGDSGTNGNGQSGSNSNVTTGDTSISPSILIIICLASAAVIVGIIIYKRKNKKK